MPPLNSVRAVATLATIHVRAHTHAATRTFPRRVQLSVGQDSNPCSLEEDLSDVLRDVRQVTRTSVAGEMVEATLPGDKFSRSFLPVMHACLSIFNGSLCQRGWWGSKSVSILNIAEMVGNVLGDYI